MCVKNARPFFDVADNEVIYLEPRKSKEKRPVGRPTYFHKIELDNNDLHDFSDILKIDQWYSKQYIRFHQKIPSPGNTRKRFSTFKKTEMRNYYPYCGNYRERTRAFKLQHSTVRKICKADPPERSNKHGGFKGEKAWKENSKGAGRPLLYPTSVDEEFLSWILVMNDIHLTVSSLALQKKAKSLILPHNPSFEASKDWIRQFKERQDLSLRKRTSLCQRLPSQLENKVSPFCSECAKFLKIGKYLFPLIGNMNQTPVFFDMIPERLLVLTGKKSVTIRTSGSEKRHMTVVLTVAADVFILPPMITF